MTNVLEFPVSKKVDEILDENKHLREILADFTDLLEDNYVKEKKFSEIEIDLMDIQKTNTIEGFFVSLASHIKDKYKNLTFSIAMAKNAFEKDISKAV